MRTLDRLLPLICACGLLQACATSHPASTPTSPAANTPQPAESNPLKQAELSGDALTDKERQNLFALGYKPMNRGGAIYYCRSEVQVGSRFSTSTCRTGEQVLQDMELAKKVAGEMQRPGFCPKGSACN